MRTTMLVGALFLVTLASFPAQGQTTDIELKNGDVLKGALVARVNDATYVVQNGDELLELKGDELAPGTLDGVDFNSRRAPGLTHHFDDVHADGTATRHWTMFFNNHSKVVWTELRMGLAPWELRMVDQRRFVDEHGMPLHVTYDPPREKWKTDSKKVVRYELELNVPLAPGEESQITGTATSQYAAKTEDGWRYRFVGDYAEDRVLYLKVKLPQWAEITSISPPASATFEDDGCQYVMWRRYYRQGERYPLEIHYKLP